MYEDEILNTALSDNNKQNLGIFLCLNGLVMCRQVLVFSGGGEYLRCRTQSQQAVEIQYVTYVTHISYKVKLVGTSQP